MAQKLKAVRNPQCDYYINENGVIDNKGLFKRYAIEIQNEGGDVVEYKSEASENHAEKFINKFNNITE